MGRRAALSSKAVRVGRRQPSSPGGAGRSLRFSAVAAPALLLLYGVLRLLDGLDGTHGPGLAWNLGHAAFLMSFVLFGVLLVEIRRLVPEVPRGQRVAATVATVMGLIGVAAFLWVIVGDLFTWLADAAPLPDPIFVAGPLLFQAGVLVLLVQQVVVPPNRLPLWSPLLVLLGFVPIAVNLDLLPLGALLVLCGLAPLTRFRGYRT